MKMQYEIIEANRKKRFSQLVMLLKSEMVTKNGRIYVIDTSNGPVLNLNNGLISKKFDIDSEEFIDFSIAHYNKDSIIKTMLTIKINLWGCSRFDFFNIPLSLECDIEKLINIITRIYNKYGFEMDFLEILTIIEDNKKFIYAYDIKYYCDYSGELKPVDVWVYGENASHLFYVKGVL